MSREALHQLVDRAMAEKKFRQRLMADPNKVLSGFDLDPEERAAAYRFRDALTSGKDPVDLGASFTAMIPMGRWF